MSDAPYDADRLALTTGWAIVGGAVASAVTAGSVAALATVSGLDLGRLFAGIGEFVGFGGGARTVAGVAAFLVMSLVFALLYGMSQQVAPPRGLLIVGLFYGFLLWIAMGRIFGWVFSEHLESMFRAWGWLAGCIAYGLALATTAIAYQATHQTSGRSVPID